MLAHFAPASGIVIAMLIGCFVMVLASGIAGTMIAGGQGVHRAMAVRIVMAWVFTLPATILIAGVLFYVLDNPNF